MSGIYTVCLYLSFFSLSGGEGRPDSQAGCLSALEPSGDDQEHLSCQGRCRLLCRPPVFLREKTRHSGCKTDVPVIGEDLNV